MPVSKKRKKDGKPVSRHTPAAAAAGGEGHAPAPEAKAGPAQRMGKPSNPFVAKQTARSAQRGR